MYKAAVIKDRFNQALLNGDRSMKRSLIIRRIAHILRLDKYYNLNNFAAHSFVS